MARKTSEDVFELIKSLATSEKRYFKIFASLHTVGDKNKYLTLFDLIEQQDSYDEAALIELMDEQGGVTFSKLKKYLYDLILKALRNYNADKSGVHELSAVINDLNILFSKGLYQHAYKMLIKAEKIAIQYELFSYNYLIENWKKRLQLHIGGVGSKINNHILNSKAADYNQLDKYLSAFAEFKSFKRKTSVVSSATEFPKLIQAILKDDISKNASLKVQFFHARIKGISHRLMLENEEYLELAKTAYEIAQEHPSLPNEDVLTYTLEPLMEYCNALLRNRQFGEFSKMIKKATPYITASKMQLNSKGKADIEAKMNLMRSEYDRLNGKMQNKDEHLERIHIVEGNEHLQPSNSMRNLYYWEMINWYFAAKDFEIALGVLDKLQMDIPEYQTESAVNCMRWILLYEMRNSKQLAAEVSDTRSSSIFEEAIRKTMIAELESPSINHMITLKKTLVQLEKGTDKIHLKFFDFIAWVNGKMLGDDSFAHIKRQLHYYHH